jgi:integrase
MTTKPRNLIPTYRRHRRTGRAIITVRNAVGSRRDILLPGEFNSTESRQQYERILTILRTNGGNMPAENGQKTDLTIAELILRFMQQHVTTYYVDPATKEPSSEQEIFKLALRPLTRLFGELPAIEFGPLSLRSVRDAMITGNWLTEEEKDKYEKSKRPIGLARTTINKHVGRIRLMFRWGVEMQLVPPHVLHGLEAVQGLRKGRSGARETAPVLPVAPEIVQETLPFMPPIVGDMVELQMLTGTRAGEICNMKATEIDMSGAVWLYRPQRHKTQWLGHQRTIAIGPRAQTIIKKYLKPKVDAYLFSPAEQDAFIKTELRANRKTKVQPSQACRKKPKAKRKPGGRFSVRGYNRAIVRACEKAGIPRWHSHMLRHTTALLIEREFGLDAARAALGHRTANITAMYSGIDLQKATHVMAAIG